VPWRDLRVSPDHALFVAGKLVPAGALVDGEAILQERHTGRITYFHVELDNPDVLIAEGVPAESWLDCGNRSQFENAGLVVSLHADFAAAGPGRTDPCAPRVEAGADLARIRRAIAERRRAQGAETARRHA
jgi:hypothetical protein